LPADERAIDAWLAHERTGVIKMVDDS